jgi:hypothetical protein
LSINISLWIPVLPLFVYIPRPPLFSMQNKAEQDRNQDATVYLVSLTRLESAYELMRSGEPGRTSFGCVSLGIDVVSLILLGVCHRLTIQASGSSLYVPLLRQLLSLRDQK